MLLLLYIEKRFWGRLKPGDVFLVYLIGYPVVRFFMEMLRLDSSTLGGINANQALMVVVGFLATATLFIRHKMRPKEQPLSEEENL